MAAAAAPAQPGAAVTLDVDGSGLVAAPASPKPQQRGVWRLLRSPVVLRELHVGVGLQVLQQVAGINTVRVQCLPLPLQFAWPLWLRRRLTWPMGLSCLGVLPPCAPSHR